MNLDRKAFMTARDIADINPNDGAKCSDACRKALNVLLEQGIFAVILYLHAKQNGKEYKGGPLIAEKLIAFAQVLFPLTPAASTDAKAQFDYLLKEITENNQRILLIRQLWESVLTYAIYYAKV